MTCRGGQAMLISVDRPIEVVMRQNYCLESEQTWLFCLVIPCFLEDYPPRQTVSFCQANPKPLGEVTKNIHHRVHLPKEAYNRVLAFSIVPRPSNLPSSTIQGITQFREEQVNRKRTKSILHTHFFWCGICTRVGHSSSMLLPDLFFPNTALRMEPALAPPPEKGSLMKGWPVCLQPTCLLRDRRPGPEQVCLGPAGSVWVLVSQPESRWLWGTFIKAGDSEKRKGLA